ncbi:MAG: hypothetical protein KBA81_04075 [Rhabdochlamydiaceae bacterium]|nr:hypothetical protein [Rhabdochlamydiaceae bacterium]
MSQITIPFFNLKLNSIIDERTRISTTDEIETSDSESAQSLERPSKTAKKIKDLTDYIFEKFNFTEEFESTKLEKITGPDITRTFCPLIAVDDSDTKAESGSSISLNQLKLTIPPPSTERTETQRLRIFFSWFLEQLAPYLEDSPDTIWKQVKKLFEYDGFLNGKAYLQAYFEKYGCTVHTLRAALSSQEFAALNELLKSKVDHYLRLSGDELNFGSNPEEISDQLFAKVKPSCDYQYYRTIPSITILRFLSIGAFAYGHDFMREKLSKFYLAKSIYIIRPCVNETTRFDISFDETDKRNYTVTQHKKYDICLKDDTEKKPIVQFMFSLSFTKAVKMCTVKYEITELSHLIQNDKETQKRIYTILKLAKACLSGTSTLGRIKK